MPLASILLPTSSKNSLYSRHVPCKEDGEEMAIESFRTSMPAPDTRIKLLIMPSRGSQYYSRKRRHRMAKTFIITTHVLFITDDSEKAKM